MAIPYDDERERRILLERVRGRSVREIAATEGLTPSRVHQILRRVRETGTYKARGGVNAASVQGLDAGELGTAIREYLASLGISE